MTIRFKILAVAVLLLASSSAIISVQASASEKMSSQQPGKPVKEYSGSVLDEKGEPMTGVTVNVENSDTYTLTDAQGHFAIKASQGAVLVFSFLGYENTRRELSSISAPMIVNLHPEALDIDEVVVIGYGSSTKRDITGSVTAINSETINSMPAANAMEALTGKIPGMQITSDNTPGGAPDIKIRGMGSFGDASPICVIDGQFFETDVLSMINSADIESISVLKDASSTAIYGSRGANGVIIITTKSGESEGGKCTVRANAWTSISEIERKLNVTNLSQWQQLQNMEYLADNWNNPSAVSSIPYPDWQNAGAGTDWQDLVTRLAVSESVDASVSGGGKNTSFFFSSAFLNQQGVVKYSGYNRYTARLNVSYSPKKWVKIGINSMFT